MKKFRIKIGGMTCSACSSGLEKYLNKQPQVVDAVVNLVLQEAIIQCEDEVTLEKVEIWIHEAGFQSLGEFNSTNLLQQTKIEKNTYVFFAILTIFIFYISMAPMLKLPICSYLNKAIFPKIYSVLLFLLVLPFFYFGACFFRNGWKNLIHKTANMDTLVMISVGSSFIYSTVYLVFILLGITFNTEYLYFDSIAMVIFFMKLGRYLDSKSKEKTVDAIQELVQMTPETAFRKNGKTEEVITIDEVKIDDVLLVKPGMRIAVDGIIIDGVTHLDESFITGEAIPVKKKKGDLVVAGSMNYDGVITYQAKRIGRDSTISEIVHLVIDATNTKSPIARVADRISSYFVSVILGIALLTLLGYLILGFPFQEALESFVTVLVVACPCALGLATPLVMVVSHGVCAKNGILIKSNEILEIAHQVDVVVFDKTGTLTYGSLKIESFIFDNTYKEEDLLTIVASIEKCSTHPIAFSFINYIKEKHIKFKKISDFQNIEGFGVSAKINNQTFYLGNAKLISKLKINNPYSNEELEFSKAGCSIVYVIKNNQVIGLFGLKDQVRIDASKVVATLKKMKKDVVMLTGDNEFVANEIAKEIGIEKVIAGVMPAKKQEFIAKLKQENKKVIMVGDGINDAPSLALADVGISVDGAVDIANNSADVIFTQNKLTSILDLVIISKETFKNIKQNLFWAFFYNGCMIPFAVGLFRPIGLEMNPIMAGFAMTLSSLTVVLNALRLKKIRLER